MCFLHLYKPGKLQWWAKVMQFQLSSEGPPNAKTKTTRQHTSQEAFRMSYKILVKGFFVLVLSCNITENSNIMGK